MQTKYDGIVRPSHSMWPKTSIKSVLSKLVVRILSLALQLNYAHVYMLMMNSSFFASTAQRMHKRPASASSTATASSDVVVQADPNNLNSGRGNDFDENVVLVRAVSGSTSTRAMFQWHAFERPRRSSVAETGGPLEVWTHWKVLTGGSGPPVSKLILTSQGRHPALHHPGSASSSHCT